MDNPKGHILIVDDDPHAVEILTRMLGREGYKCVGASSGRMALEKLKQEPVDVILLDVMMPEMDGLQVCQRLREDEALRQIPVILLTAKDDIDTRSKGMMLGVSEYLTKPINKRELFTRIQAQVHARALGRKLSETAVAVETSDKSE
ncbi:response regulator [Candidatus Binatia bacterium]|nr:response regulator [Candidatus Binatia bacterium]